jgi:hypothetical protein
MRVTKKSVKRALNLQDLLCLTVFIYIIYLLAILLRYRLPGLKSIYLLREHYTKSIAERSYSLLRGSDFSLQISLPRAIPMHPVRPFRIKTISVDSLSPILNFLWLVEQSLLRFEMRRMVAWLLYLAACPEIGFVKAQLFTSALRERFVG